MNPIRSRLTRIASVVLLFSFLVSCATPTPAPTPQVFAPFILATRAATSPTITPFQPVAQTDTSVPLLPTSTPTQQPTVPPSATFTQFPTQTQVPPTNPPPAVTFTSPPPSAPSRTNYILYATMDFASRTLDVEETIRYYNGTGLTLSDIVLSVQPNLYGGAFVLNTISQDSVALTTYTLNGQALTMNLPQPLPAGSATTLTLSFRLNVPAKGAGLFGYDFNQINLVDWYPFVVP
ncbi:MAG TPA: hypothetical protein PKN81_00140, partial [Anaerolineales bacterium]|nr:hypothetical protein [Anaerolineales bacterium]